MSGGGTGGHIYPAIAIADELKVRFPQASILFVGAKDKMEMQKVPQADYLIKGLWISGLQRKLTVQNLLFPIKVIHSLYHSWRILKQYKPNVVIGTGGFASGPLLKMASLLEIPTVIQEQNSYPGITNKMLAPKAKAICVAYENLERFFPAHKIHLTGNPVRQDLIDVDTKREEALTYFNLDKTKKTILILGGSLGSRRINQQIEKELVFFDRKNTQLIWQCGKLYADDYMNYNQNEGVQVLTFIDRMDLVYAAADIIISRAGASSVSELCIVGKPVIYIPSPNVAEDHQTKNAQAIVDMQAALLVKENELDTSFEHLVSTLLDDQALCQSLSTNAKSNAKTQATQDIVNQIIQLLP